MLHSVIFQETRVLSINTMETSDLPIRCLCIHTSIITFIYIHTSIIVMQSPKSTGTSLEIILLPILDASISVLLFHHLPINAKKYFYFPVSNCVSPTYATVNADS